MNADAEKEIDRLLNMLIHPSTARPIIIAAMQFAYADAARVCKEEKLVDHGGSACGITYDLAIYHCTQAIEQRAKE